MWHTDIRKASKCKGEEVKTDVRETHRAGNPGFLKSDRKEALMVTGARQVGKTYIIRECAKEIYKNIVEINFVENQQAVKLFENITGSKDILLRLSALTDVPMIPGETLIFSMKCRNARKL